MQKGFESLFLPSSTLSNTAASLLLNAQHCHWGTGDSASLMTAPEREGGDMGEQHMKRAKMT